jgi:hypothetical protein
LAAKVKALYAGPDELRALLRDQGARVAEQLAKDTAPDADSGRLGGRCGRWRS